MSLSTVAVLSLNFFLTCIAETLGGLRAAAGLFRPDRYWHLAMAVLNLVVSVVLVKQIGILGVFLGTTLCKVLKELIILPRIVCRRILHRSVWQYLSVVGGYLATTAALAALSYFLCGLLPIGGLFGFALRCLIGLAISTLGMVVLYHRTEEFAVLWKLFVGVIKKVCSKKESVA